ncbi:SigE family RNA polymerase sigma factor [Micromonospora sp. KC721]|uniref:SigE family RNA polymerase sigma factor n=1 Tax=Micromonospora sp. KC721 TaxID=2530380 RepID=UPI0010491E3E|nr:SigE family RNA polymerase sigma factor [Micromonospora sp. KC721]TDB74603.1 SigE family RNA polymerase sigma factor [Micromonospora sp. KC721]
MRAGGRDDAFHSFFESHHADLARLAYLVTGEPEVADDLAADALLEVWRHWDRVAAADSPIAYARGVLANLARNRIRRLSRERRGLLGVGLLWRDRTQDVDVPVVVDVREALRRLPYRRRACVVLRYAFDLSERETARTLGISVGTVKSQTSRGAAQLTRLLGGPPASAGDGTPWLAPASRAIVPPGPSGRGS